MREKHAKKVGGASANALVMPIVVVLAILHALIIIVILMINASSSSLSTIMQNSGSYTQDATSLLAGSSLLSETATNFVLMPTTEAGEVNVYPLIAYASELSVPRRGNQVLGRFQDYDVSEEALAHIEAAAASAGSMMENQLRAIELMRAVYPLPEMEPLTAISRVELSPEELNMTDAEKQAAAKELVLGTDYAQNKQSVSQNVSACTEQLQAASARQAAETGRRIAILRSVLWTITLSIIVMLIVTFTALYRQIMQPLGRFVKLIPEDKPLDEGKGFHEVRLVASAYNDVLKRRNALDDILRSAAETDALTNLPNRYRFEQYLLESEESGYSMAVLLFDVNYLKTTNDTLGHLAGDKLIRTAAECIASCFGDENESNCFRFGGDEFAAVVKNCTPDMIRRMVKQFEEEERQRNVSISLGYAYAEEIGDTSFKQLLDEADKQMYAYKKAVHSQALQH
ncbi:MAG: GGDEF domain-containing protein [Clostridia bacterium]|nr:GGDEF domain-containing protein [Clostridia bacterium]